MGNEETKDDKQIIVLEDLDGAIVLSAEGNLDMYIPDVEDLPETSQLLVAFALKLHDAEWRDNLLDWFQNQVEKVEEEEVDGDEIELDFGLDELELDDDSELIFEPDSNPEDPDVL